MVTNNRKRAMAALYRQLSARGVDPGGGTSLGRAMVSLVSQPQIKSVRLCSNAKKV